MAPDTTTIMKVPRDLPHRGLRASTLLLMAFHRARASTDWTVSEALKHLGSNGGGELGRQDNGLQPVTVGMAEARWLHQEATVRLVDDADALHDKGDVLNQDLG